MQENLHVVSVSYNEYKIWKEVKLLLQMYTHDYK